MNAAAILHKAIVAISGQGDHLETPKRHLVPGRWNHDGRAVPQCTGGGCNQGRRPERCDCRLYVLHPHLHRVTLTEIDDETAFPIERTFRGMTTAQKQAERERKANARCANLRALAAGLGGILAFALILALFQPPI